MSQNMNTKEEKGGDGEAPTPLGARSKALISAANIQADVTSCIHVIILTSGSNPIAISRVYFHLPPKGAALYTTTSN